jgi:hypothetical protein
MINRWVLASLLAGVVAMAPAALSAQQPARAQAAPKAKQAPREQPPEPDVEELTPGQIQRAQEPEPPSAQSSRPATPKPAAEPSRAIACSGIFAKDSSHLKLATMYKPQNVVFTEVDGPDGTKLMASVLFPKEPKRRLEVLWQNEAARMGTALIVINGQSTWTAPKGLKLGLQVAAIEKLNNKPFKLRGFDKDGSSVTDWQGGALEQLPGGCKVGIRLMPDAKTPPEARSEASGSKEFVSSDAKVRAIRATIAEIILGY